MSDDLSAAAPDRDRSATAGKGLAELERHLDRSLVDLDRSQVLHPEPAHVVGDVPPPVDVERRDTRSTWDTSGQAGRKQARDTFAERAVDLNACLEKQCPEVEPPPLLELLGRVVAPEAESLALVEPDQTAERPDAPRFHNHGRELDRAHVEQYREGDGPAAAQRDVLLVRKTVAVANPYPLPARRETLKREAPRGIRDIEDPSRRDRDHDPGEGSPVEARARGPHQTSGVR